MTVVTPVSDDPQRWPDVVSPAESAAASLCWLARFQLRAKFHGDRGGERIADKVEGYWHNRPCRYCPVPPTELMRRINAANAALEGSDTLAAFKALPPKARTARVREAQEEPWYDQITRAG